MQNRTGVLVRKAFTYGLLFSSSLAGAMRAHADSDDKSATTAAQSTERTATSPTAMTSVAPYGVRLRVTGFLARQHASEGNKDRALVEFYSMLNVDDPSWRDDEQGDSMRVARDIDVAQMMTEVGFYDHAIRILQSALILTSVNHDPQKVLVERQMQATVDVARLKGASVPAVDLSFLADREPVRSASSDLPHESVVVTPSHGTVPEKSPDTAAGHADQKLVQPPPASPPSELPAIKAARIPAEESPAQSEKAGRRAGRSLDRSQLSRLAPSRWRQKKDIVPAVAVQEEPAAMPEQPATPAQPTTSPNLAPTYCQECSGLHGYAPGNVVVRYNPRTGITHTHVVGNQPPSAMPSPYQKTFTQLQPELPAARTGSAPYTTSNSDLMLEPPPTLPSAPAAAPSDPASTPNDLQLRSYDAPQSASETARTGSAVHQTADRRSSELSHEGQPAAPATPSGSAAATHASSPTIAQVGIAGDVSNPGIFALQGRSTTLAALLRRTGEPAIGSDKHARILRTVEFRDGNSTDSARDYYCQRLDGLESNKAAMDTPIYGQEIVIVDGPGEKPIYVAVMPHFILQVPVDPTFALTTDQIVEQLRVHWPSVRGQSIGILRYEQWGSSASESRVRQDEQSGHAALVGGDVVYVDASDLDRSQVLAAAQSIARMAGAHLRKHDSATLAQP